jgi:hypothetical protein
MKRTKALDTVEMVQPRDQKHEIYSLFKTYLVYADVKIVAAELGVRSSAVSMVKSGKGTSQRIFNKLVSVAMVRKDQESKVMEYLNKPLTSRFNQ